MEFEVLLEEFIGEALLPQVLTRPLPDEFAAAVVERLKQEADRHWSIDASRSLEFADRMIAIGNARQDPAQMALGWMARGDALRFLGRMEEAWETLEQAGNLFETAGDQVGWARTRIGRLYLAVKLCHVKETLLDAKEAQRIFQRNANYELLVRLNMARAVVYASVGRLHRALRLFHSTLALAETLGASAQQHLGTLYMNIGVAHDDLGDFSQALIYYERAQSIFNARDETRNIALVELNMAYIAQAQGNYRQSLQRLHGILERGMQQFPMEHLAIKRDMTECYLQLNRYAEARDLAQEVVAGYRSCQAAFETARSLLHLATAEAELGELAAAHAALEEARDIFAALGATSWQAIVRLRHGRIALKQEDMTTAYSEAKAAVVDFEAIGQIVNHAAALLLQGQVLLGREEFDLTSPLADKALRIAQQYNVPSLRYTSHLLLGNVAKAQQRVSRAVRHYQAAVCTIERLQRGLTITLRPGFLEDKGDAARALTALYLRIGQVEKAFETIENSKSQVLLGHLLNREHLRWRQNTPEIRTLIDELEKLRAEHQWFYRLAHDPPRSDGHLRPVSTEEARRAVATRERRMRTVTDQLYLLNAPGDQSRVRRTSLRDIQDTLRPEDLLIEFYHDNTRVWAFVLDRQTIEVHSLPVALQTLNHLLQQLQANVRAALTIGRQTSAFPSLTCLAQRILQRLHGLLLEPLSLARRNPRRLVIVPYGCLHYLPFNLLHDGSHYLIEKQEVVLLPAAGLATHAAPRQQPGALILADSYQGRLPNTLAEAKAVQELFGGELYANENACRNILQRAPGQILHIAAHGQHRLDRPELSFLQLGDGQLYADDLLQEDLRYELVTLSGCETGRANVVASDELIGLGRGLLYAGAGALVLSHWRVADDSTLDFMQRMYKALRIDRKSKAAALACAQRSLIEENRLAHPAFWGAFQLIGNADPLTA